jgi:hypothetical protein
MTDADPEPLELGRNEQLTDSQMTESLTTSCGVSLTDSQMTESLTT